MIGDYGVTPNPWRPAMVPPPGFGEDLGVGNWTMSSVVVESTTTLRAQLLRAWERYSRRTYPSVTSGTLFAGSDYPVEEPQIEAVLVGWGGRARATGPVNPEIQLRLVSGNIQLTGLAPSSSLGPWRNYMLVWPWARVVPQVWTWAITPQASGSWTRPTLMQAYPPTFWRTDHELWDVPGALYGAIPETASGFQRGDIPPTISWFVDGANAEGWVDETRVWVAYRVP